MIPRSPSFPDMSSTHGLFEGAPKPHRESDEANLKKLSSSGQEHAIQNVTACSQGDAPSASLVCVPDRSSALSLGTLLPSLTRSSDSVLFQRSFETGTALSKLCGSNLGNSEPRGGRDQIQPEVTGGGECDVIDGSGGGTSLLDSVLRLDLRRVNGRLNKYQAKADKLQHGRESRRSMLGVLSIRRHLLQADVVRATHMVQASRHCLDQQRSANKALLKRIDQLMALDNARMETNGSAATTPTTTSSNIAVIDTHPGHGDGYEESSLYCNSRNSRNVRPRGSRDNPWCCGGRNSGGQDLTPTVGDANHFCPKSRNPHCHDLAAGGLPDHSAYQDVCVNHRKTYHDQCSHRDNVNDFLAGVTDLLSNDRNNSHDLGRYSDHSFHGINSGRVVEELGEQHPCTNNEYNSYDLGEWEVRSSDKNNSHDLEGSVDHSIEDNTNCSDLEKHAGRCCDDTSSGSELEVEGPVGRSIENDSDSRDLTKHTDVSSESTNSDH